MTPRRRRPSRSAQPPQNEAARLTRQLMDLGRYTKRDVARILGRDASLVSQFFTKGKGASFVPALRTAVEALRLGAATDVGELRDVVAGQVSRRTTAQGLRARVRGKDIVATPGNSSMARAGRQHIASGASRLLPVVQNTAAVGGKLAFTVRAKKGGFTHDAGSDDDSAGQRRNVVKRRDGTEERAYGNRVGPGDDQYGFDAREWLGRVEAANWDVAAAVRNWLIETGRIHPDTVLTHLEIRGWKPAEEPGTTREPDAPLT